MSLTSMRFGSAVIELSRKQAPIVTLIQDNKGNITFKSDGFSKPETLKSYRSIRNLSQTNNLLWGQPLLLAKRFVNVLHALFLMPKQLHYSVSFPESGRITRNEFLGLLKDSAYRRVETQKGKQTPEDSPENEELSKNLGNTEKQIRFNL